MRLIADGVVDRHGVAGLAERLGYSPRHLHRQLCAELGAGPLALARAQRAQAARVLVETTDLNLSRVALAAGFASVRQFNDTMREVYGRTPSTLRAQGRRGASTLVEPGWVRLRLALREPFDGRGLLEFFAARAVEGVEEVEGQTYRRTLALAHGSAVVELTPAADHVEGHLRLADLRDLGAAVQRCRRLLDLDADPATVDSALACHELLAPLVLATPGMRVPGAVDAAEIAVRAVLGQQVSVAAARTLAGRLTRLAGEPLPAPAGALTHAFPSAERLAEADLGALGVPRRRAEALHALCTALAGGELTLHPGVRPEEAHAALCRLPGIGPWTASYVTMRALGDPDAFLPTDLGVRKVLRRLGRADDPAAATRTADAWRPWRSYALMHLWRSDGATARDS